MDILLVVIAILIPLGGIGAAMISLKKSIRIESVLVKLNQNLGKATTSKGHVQKALLKDIESARGELRNIELKSPWIGKLDFIQNNVLGAHPFPGIHQQPTQRKAIGYPPSGVADFLVLSTISLAVLLLGDQGYLVGGMLAVLVVSFTAIIIMQLQQQKEDHMANLFAEITTYCSQPFQNSQLAGQMQETHQQLVQFLSLVPNMEELPLWLEEVHKTIIPLRSTSHSIAEKLQYLEKTSQLVENFINRQDSMEEVYKSTSNVIQEWATEEHLSREKFSNTVVDHLKNFNTLNEELKQKLGSVEQFSRNVEQVFEDLEKEIPAATRQLTKVGEDHERIAVKVDLVITKLEVFSNDIAGKVLEIVQQHQNLESSMQHFLNTWQQKMEKENPFLLRWLTPISILAGASVVGLSIYWY